MRTPRILIVDDDPALLRALTEALRLRMSGLTVDLADSGASALARVAEADYDAVVTDIKMPGMDGLALLDEIRAKRPEIPTLLITGHGQHDLAVQALRGGAFDFIQKPIDRDYFVASLHRALQVRQLSREVESQRRALEQHAADLEQAIAERTRELREANRLKDEFLATLAHELRNPLAAILGAAELMAACPDGDDSLQSARGVVGHQARQMSRLLDDLLDISRITRNRIELRRTRVDLAQVIAGAIETSRSAAEAAGHLLSVSLPKEPLYLDADHTRLEQVLVNLLNNAVKYTSPGGRIALAARRDADRAVIEVRDNGMGIPPDVLPHVFDMFVQADRSLGRAHDGLGIGLTLVRTLVELHGGSVQAHSEGPGHGSRFVVRLPIAVESPSEPAIAAPAATAAPSRRILLVDDNRAMTKMLSALLRQCGHDVIAVVHDGTTVVETALEHELDVILLDIGLPGVDGYEVARRLRSHRELEHVMLVAMTGYGQEEDRRRCLLAGFDHHLVKPAPVEALQRIFAQPRPQVQPT